MAAKKVRRLQVEVYFLNGLQRAWLLNPASDKLMFDPKRKVIVIHHENAKITIHREFVAYYAEIDKVFEASELEDRMANVLAATPPSLDLR